MVKKLPEKSGIPDEQLSFERSEESEIKLLPDETTAFMINVVPAISSVTWYSGDIHTVKEPLRQRISAILRSNPWIAGRLKKNGDGQIVLVHGSPEEALNDIDSIFQCYDESDEIILHRHYQSYRSLTHILKPALVPKSNELIGQNKPIWKVSLIAAHSENGNGNIKQFALVTSLAHCVGDGHTYYAIQNMLNLDQIHQNAGDTDITSAAILHTKRKTEIYPQIDQAMGGPSSLSKAPFGFLLRYMRGAITSKLFGPETCAKLFMVNQKWIREQKAMVTQNSHSMATESDRGKFVSTNDIICSQLYKSTGTDKGLIAIDFRSKIPNCLHTDAGNYFGFIHLSPKDYESPLHIRNIVWEIQNGGRKNYPSMTSWEHITSMKQLVTCSNWSTFCKPLSMGDSCVQDLHMPLIELDMFPARYGSGAYIFRPGVEKDVAVLFLGHPLCLERLEASGMVGNKIF